MLKLVTAVIKPQRLDEVKDALLTNGIEGMTITEVRGYGRQRGKTENFRGSEYKIDFIPKIKVEVVVPAEMVERVTTLIVDAARTGKIGDGKVWSFDVDSLVRVRTGEAGNDAL
jgi:nitrogen regulatory protein P-II 1